MLSWFFSDSRFPSLVVFCFFALVVVALPTGCGGEEATPTPTRAPLRISAVNLYSAKQNATAWEANYLNRWGIVSGEVSSVGPASDKYDVKLAAEKPARITSPDIVCKMDRGYADAVSRLRRGQEITVLGHITGEGIVDLVIDYCTLQ